MSDRLSALLQRFELRARVFHSGALCGQARFDTGRRMGVARQLLRKGLTVKRVAAEVGYASLGAFGRAFLQRVGTTPTRWQHRDVADRAPEQPAALHTQEHTH